MFKGIASLYRMPSSGDVWIIEDPQEAREMIQEAGLREAGQKEAGSGPDIAKILEEEGLK